VRVPTGRCFVGVGFVGVTMRVCRAGVMMSVVSVLSVVSVVIRMRVTHAAAGIHVEMIGFFAAAVVAHGRMVGSGGWGIVAAIKHLSLGTRQLQGGRRIADKQNQSANGD